MKSKMEITMNYMNYTKNHQKLLETHELHQTYPGT